MTQVKMVCFIEQTDYISCHLPKDAHSCQLLREIKKPTNPKAKENPLITYHLWVSSCHMLTSNEADLSDTYFPSLIVGCGLRGHEHD